MLAFFFLLAAKKFEKRLFVEVKAPRPETVNVLHTQQQAGRMLDGDGDGPGGKIPDSDHAMHDARNKLP